MASSDPELRCELESLLFAHNDLHSSFLPQAGETNPRVPGTVGQLAVGMLLDGRFELLEKIGEGGMGQVWLAEQRRPVKRRVALKLIRAGFYDDALIRRFESERQSLAIMDHYAIAKVFEAGTTEQGQPYFVMEYVPGLPITDYCDQKRLTTKERLELFIQACEGVQHAHQKAIIHRDLKPGNILVTDTNGKPTPRIIDFGLAKAAGPRLDDERSFTHLGTFVGTPGYMSPEQADLNVQDIDTRTDVYSLGAILYVLLCGTRPLDDRPNEKLPFDELLRKLREEEAVRPSERVDADREKFKAIAEARGTEPRQLAFSLRGDLDWITMKALEKDRARRYGTPSELAADLRRYLNHEPVTARPAGTAYRIRKYCRRHRVGLGAASVISLALIVAAVVSIREGVRANREAAVAEAVNDFLQNDLLAQAGASAQSGPNTKPQPDLKVRTALDRAAERIGGKFAKQPEVEAAIRETVGWTYVDLGLYPEARGQLEQAFELRRRISGMGDVKTLETMSRLGNLAHLQGRYAEAEMLQHQAFDGLRRALGLENPSTVRSGYNLATIYTEQAKYAEAEAIGVPILAIGKRVLGPEHPETLKSMDNLAGVYYWEGKLPQAESLYSETTEICKRVLGQEHPTTLAAMSDLAVVYEGEGKLAQAEALDALVLETRRRVLGPDHPDTVASVNNLAVVYDDEKKYAQAEALYTQALEIRKRVMGPDSADTAETEYNLACLAAQRGAKDRAIALLYQCVDHGLAPRAALRIDQDGDLAALHGDPRFVSLVAHAKQVAEGKQKATAPVTAQ